MAPILPHMELRPTQAFLTLQDKNMKCRVQQTLSTYPVGKSSLVYRYVVPKAAVAPNFPSR